MALQGNVDDFGLVDILQMIGLQKKTGLLQVQKGSDSATFFFEDGQIVYAHSSQRGDTEKIGQILLKEGKITEAQLKEVLEKQQSSKALRVGQILESMRYADRSDIQEALQFQVKEILFSALRWQEGTYKFESESVTFDRKYHIPLPTEFLLMESLRMIDEWPYIEKRIPSFRMIFGKVLAAEDQAHPYLVPEEERIYHVIDGRKDVEDIIEEIQIGEFETCKILVNLLVSGLIQEVGTSRKQETPAAYQKSAEVSRFLKLVQWPLVIVLVVVLLGSGFPLSIWGLREWSSFQAVLQEAVTKHRIDQIDQTLTLYYLQNGKFPDQLDRLVKEGWIRKASLRDGYGNTYQYLQDEVGYKIYSLEETN